MTDSIACREVDPQGERSEESENHPEFSRGRAAGPDRIARRSERSSHRLSIYAGSPLFCPGRPNPRKEPATMVDPTLYLAAAVLYGTQARDALAHRHPCAVYIGLALVHLAMGLKKALAG